MELRVLPIGRMVSLEIVEIDELEKGKNKFLKERMISLFRKPMGGVSCIDIIDTHYPAIPTY